jgi:iron(III) transport system permease protein
MFQTVQTRKQTPVKIPFLTQVSTPPPAFPNDAHSTRRVWVGGFLTALPAVVVFGVCSGLPLLWMVGAVIFASPAVRAELHITSFRAQLLARTIGYNGLAAIIATLMGIPAAFVLGRGRGWLARILWVLLPAALLMPSLSYAYGWSQLARLCRPTLRPLGVTFIPGGTADTIRCIWSLAAWLWAVPAGLMGLALRRLDTNVQQQALLDGAPLRVTLRQLLPAIIASWSVVTVLATQEFAVYEPTGISVIATEVRMVFDTGAVSSPDNLIAGPVIQGTGAASPDQPARAAAAVATAMPLLVLTVLLAGIVAWTASRMSAAEAIAIGQWPRVLDASWASIVLTLILVVINLGVPVFALIKALVHPLSPWQIWLEFEPQVTGAVIVACIAATVAAIAAFSAAGRWTRGLLVLGGASFLLGGQLLAIADIRIYNRPGLIWAYDNFPVPVFAYVGRFGWLALAASWGTWSRPWRELRDMAATDGAGTWRTALSVVWPLAWPTLLAGGLLVGALSMTEVPATVLIFPQNPQVLTPQLMTWVHMAHYDPMIEASLLLMAVVLLPALGAVGLAALGIRIMSRTAVAKTTAMR